MAGRITLGRVRGLEQVDEQVDRKDVRATADTAVHAASEIRWELEAQSAPRWRPAQTWRAGPMVTVCMHAPASCLALMCR